MSSLSANRSNLTIVYQDIAALNPRKSNPRTHSKKQIDQIARAITQFGFTNPVLIDDANGIIAGHGRVAAAKLVGMSQVPTVRLGDERSRDPRLCHRR
ncbi:ParB-like chromosome segregation protein Spo0J [Nitrobacter vulgaris]|jgi:ParB-like chromosome segregation protein Spo0J|uniref:ParB/Srx family N-terminal domain-containing protein n=1 Tax=Nitrobacter vulgaris TaxID=29421 RepID=UPI00285B55A1|nr:ParB/Srx family N-terminal domain-containing protein [Nitrobacter vulgaris]MDR6306004.1 ParB-like chromosome segregation protein Spo0J [Nitrobacter vulgaris]